MCVQLGCDGTICLAIRIKLLFQLVICSVVWSTPFQTFAFFFFNDTATTEIYTLSLHDALPICPIQLRSVVTRIVPALPAVI